MSTKVPSQIVPCWQKLPSEMSCQLNFHQRWYNVDRKYHPRCHAKWSSIRYSAMSTETTLRDVMPTKVPSKIVTCRKKHNQTCHFNWSSIKDDKMLTESTIRDVMWTEVLSEILPCQQKLSSDMSCQPKFYQIYCHYDRNTIKYVISTEVQSKMI